jgi:hypothetical protein
MLFRRRSSRCQLHIAATLPGSALRESVLLRNFYHQLVSSETPKLESPSLLAIIQSRWITDSQRHIRIMTSRVQTFASPMRALLGLPLPLGAVSKPPTYPPSPATPLLPKPVISPRTHIACIERISMILAFVCFRSAGCQLSTTSVTTPLTAKLPICPVAQ